jgi:hypothetical protein
VGWSAPPGVLRSDGRLAGGGGRGLDVVDGRNGGVVGLGGGGGEGGPGEGCAGEGEGRDEATEVLVHVWPFCPGNVYKKILGRLARFLVPVIRCDPAPPWCVFLAVDAWREGRMWYERRGTPRG